MRRPTRRPSGPRAETARTFAVKSDPAETPCGSRARTRIVRLAPLASTPVSTPPAPLKSISWFAPVLSWNEKIVPAGNVFDAPGSIDSSNESSALPPLVTMTGKSTVPPEAAESTRSLSAGAVTSVSVMSAA